MMKRTRGEKAFSMVNALVLLLLAFTCLMPIIYVVAGSFSDPVRLRAHTGFLFWPTGYSLDGYRMAFSHPNLFIGYRNTIFYVVTGTCLRLICNSMSAFVMSRKGLLWKKPLFVYMMIPMFFSGGLIPSYLNIRALGLLNTWLVMVLPGAIAVWDIIVLRTSFLSLPGELEESAKLDGASDFQVLMRIILPVCKPTLAALALFSAVACWNDWFTAAIYLKRRDLFPLQNILREILLLGQAKAMLNEMGASSGNLLANQSMQRILEYSMTVLATVPILVVYPFLQKHFAKGVMIGSIKG